MILDDFTHARKIIKNKDLTPENTWFDNENFVEERLANRIRLSTAERNTIDAATSVLQQHVAINVADFTIGGRSPPSRIDCYCLAFGQVRPAVVVTDDIGMHVLAEAFELPIWHGPELLKIASGSEDD